MSDRTCPVRKHFTMKTSCYILCTTICLAFLFPGAMQAAKRPNVLVIVADDMGYADMGTQGARGFKTPNLDRMAREGTRFSQFYVAQAVCTASRVGIITGRYQYRLAVGLEEPLGNNARVGVPPSHSLI